MRLKWVLALAATSLSFNPHWRSHMRSHVKHMPNVRSERRTLFKYKYTHTGASSRYLSCAAKRAKLECCEACIWYHIRAPQGSMLQKQSVADSFIGCALLRPKHRLAMERRSARRYFLSVCVRSEGENNATQNNNLIRVTSIDSLNHI